MKNNRSIYMPLMVTLVCGSGVSVAPAQNLFTTPMPAPATQAPAQAPAAPTAPSTPGTPSGPGGAGNGGAPGAPDSTPAAPEAAPTMTGAALMAPPSLREMSLLVVVPPEARKFQIHDKVDIIVNETSNQKHEQKLDSKKSYDLAATLRQFPSLQALLLKNTLQDGIDGDTPDVGIGSSNTYKGSGTYERKDKFTARIAAVVIDVKPNGLLLVEARKAVSSDDESQTMVLSGLCDPKDISKSNTVQSSQLADLTLRVKNLGQVRNSSEKGLIPRAFDAIFNF